MLCNIFMLYNENEGGASPDGRGKNGPDRGSYIHTDEFMMIFPASLMIHRSSRVQGEVTSAELNEQVRECFSTQQPRLVQDSSPGCRHSCRRQLVCVGWMGGWFLH